MTMNYYTRIGGRAAGVPNDVPAFGAFPPSPPPLVVSQEQVIPMRPLNTENITPEQVEALPETIQEIITCPITLQIMSDPVMDIRGRTYDRDAIVHFLRTREEAGGTPVDPMDQQPIPYLFIPNMAVRNLIKHYFPTVGGRRKLTKKKKSRKSRKSRKR